MKDFKKLLLRGNLVDTAVGIVIGLAFAAVVTALVADLITPLIAAMEASSAFFATPSASTAAGSCPRASQRADRVRGDRGRDLLPRRQARQRSMKRYKAEPPVDETVRQCPTA